MERDELAYQIPPKSRAREGLSAVALGIYGVLVLVVTMWPTPLDRGYESSINKLLGVLHRNGIPDWFGYYKLEFAANMVMFVPLGFLVAMILPQRIWWLALLICPGLSIAIEVTQATLLSARFATVNDVVANSLGAVFGAVVATAIRATVYSRDEKVIARALWSARQEFASRQI